MQRRKPRVPAVMRNRASGAGAYFTALGSCDMGPGPAVQRYTLRRVRDRDWQATSSGRVKRTLAKRINIDAKVAALGGAQHGRA